MPTVHANDIEICYDERGEGVPLLLIMGLGCQMIHWSDGLCDAFAAAGHRVIRFDNRDSGLSTHFTGARAPTTQQMAWRRALGLPIRTPYRLEDMADDTVGLMDALGVESAHLVGVSLGGMIAQTVAIHHPTRARSLTSIMSHTGERRFLLGRPSALRALLVQSPKDRNEAGERVIKIMGVIGSPKYPRTDEYLRWLGEIAYDRNPEASGYHRQIAAVLASGSRLSALRKLQLPTLVLHGEDDPLIRLDAGRATAEAIPGAQLVGFPGMAHDLPEELWPDFVRHISELTGSN